MKKDIDGIGLDIEIGMPTLVNSYTYDKNSFTYVMLNKYAVEGEEPYLVAMTMNGILINERLVWMAYYLRYKDEKTITKLKKRTNYILNALSQ